MRNMDGKVEEKKINTKARIMPVALTLSFLGAVFIQNYEGFKPQPYKDAVGVATVCWGSTTNVVMGELVTYEECVQRFARDIKVAELGVQGYITAPLTQRQYDALVSFTFNLGVGNLQKSTLRKLINSGECYVAAREFLKWDKAGGKRLPGLSKRRIAESRMFIEDCNAWNNQNGNTVA